MPVCKEEPVKEVLIATNNAHKVEEIRTALNFEGWTFTTLAEAGVTSDPAEDADSFEGNARIKARAARAAARGVAGALCGGARRRLRFGGGRPGRRAGVFSARYAGSDGDDAANNAKLLAELAAVPDAECTARFVCTLVFIDEDGTESVARGTIEGSIGREPRGSEGFGYDPLFLPDEYGGMRALAEVSQAEKNGISHRGNALRVLKKALSQSVDER